MDKIKAKSIPNILTIIRIILAIFAILFVCLYKAKNAGINYTLYHYFFSGMYFYIPVAYIIAGSIFLVACATDWIDGHLARKYNWISDFGKLWDPIADKILIDGLLIALAVNNSIPVFVPIIMIIRDIIVDAMRMYASSKGNVVAANIWGKLKTVAQMIAIATTFFAFGIVENAQNHLVLYYFVVNLLYLIACTFSITSGIIYAINIHGKSNKANVTKKQI